MAELPPHVPEGHNPFAPDYVPPPARAAATLVLLRPRDGDGTGIEVLLVRRNQGSRFMPGIWVFPGGAVDAEELILGVSGAEVDTEADELAHRAAAIRELHEEAGIELAPEAELVPIARWITPEAEPLRYDTRFYVALAPPDAPLRPDGSEIIAATWIEPEQALAGGEHGEIELVVPTIRQLEWLLQFERAEEALAAARNVEVTPIMPIILPSDEAPGWRMVLPGDEGYRPPRL